ncbi:hypothetical protein AURDEDRAFT_161082 [Auricularia subglabra TFB-10046 SS5]|nr:hypothetical protein AURDEDRAFT_161082 [Auricularia subglabra TFB-10046 SS5]
MPKSVRPFGDARRCSPTLAEARRCSPAFGDHVPPFHHIAAHIATTSRHPSTPSGSSPTSVGSHRRRHRRPPPQAGDLLPSQSPIPSTSALHPGLHPNTRLIPISARTVV